jgi:pyridoxamine 5'-phosphate oxidase
LSSDKGGIDLESGPSEGMGEADFTTAREPFSLFEAWFQDAAKSEPNDPNAMALATADESGLPNVRMVLLKGIDGADVPSRGFVFYTNSESAKGRELEANPRVGLLFHWKSLRRQVRVRGNVVRVSPEEADAYFSTRPRLSRIGAWASDQSRPLESRFALEKRVAKLTAKFGVSEIERPPHWMGFRVTPLEIEFWQDKPFRLHDRLVFRRNDAATQWSATRLYP